MYIVSDEKIEEQEQKGRAIYLSIFTGMTWHCSQSKYDTYDASGSTISKVDNTQLDIFSEIKVREISSTDYYTSFLEVKKYASLIELTKSNPDVRAKAFYFVHYNDKVAYLFDLTAIKPDEYTAKWRLMKEVSLDGQTKMVEKLVYELPLTDAVKRYVHKTT